METLPETLKSMRQYATANGLECAADEKADDRDDRVHNPENNNMCVSVWVYDFITNKKAATDGP